MKIESSQNDLFKTLLSLTSSKGLKAEGLFLLSGEKLIREYIKAPHLEIIYEIALPDQPFVTSDTKKLEFPKALFAQLDVLGTNFNILVLKQPPIATFTAKDLEAYVPSGVEVVAPIGDPGNLGALIRSCEAFSIPRVFLSREAAHPFLPKSVKASAGSVLRVPLAHGPALAEFPHNSIALDTEGVAIDDFTWPKEAFLVVGEEGPGLNRNQFANRVRVPTEKVESLNVVVAASIAFSYIARRKS